MIRRKGRYCKQTVELDEPLDLAEGTAVELVIRPVEAGEEAEAEAWAQLGMSRLEEEWDNPADSIYDDWKSLYGVQSR